MSSVPPPSWMPPQGELSHPAPPLHPEVPDGIEPTKVSGVPTWPWWAGLAALAAALGGALVFSLPFFIIGGDVEDPPPGSLIGATLSQQLCFIGAAVGLAWITVGRPKPWDFGLRPSKFWVSFAYVLGGYVAFITFSAAWVALLGIDDQDTLPDELGVDESTAALVAVAFMVCVGAPVAEEFLFRGFIFTALRRLGGVWPAAALTGLLFGAIHIGSSPVGFLVPLAIFGTVLCIVYWLTGSLYPAIALHCLNNCIAFGVSQDWGVEILPLFVGAMAIITLSMLLVRRVTGPPPAAGRPAPALG